MEARAAAPASGPGAIAPADVRRLRATAHDIESMFLQQILKTMRQATPGLQGPLSGTGQRVYQDMMDEQLARSMAKGGGIGLADMLVRDVLRRQGVETKPSSPPAAVPIAEPGGLP